jgi:hypothetical protein
MSKIGRAMARQGVIRSAAPYRCRAWPSVSNCVDRYRVGQGRKDANDVAESSRFLF